MEYIKKFHEAALDETYVEGSDQEVFSGRLLHVHMDHVLLPNGEDTTREFIRHPGATAVVPVLDDGRIILVKQCRHALDTIMWEIPAGKLDHGPSEDPLECAKRELSEETGYTAEHIVRIASIATTPGFADEIIHLYKAWGLKAGAQHTDEDEFVGVKAYTMDEIKAMVRAGELFDAKTLSALYACELLQDKV